MRSSKKNSRITREEEADQKYPDLWMDRAEDKVRPNGCRSRRKREHALFQRNEIPACVVTVKEAKHQAEC
jgi:hypothetical protein